MATFAELVSDTYILTNRPDLVSETKLAVKAATLKAHQSDFFPKDLYEIGIQWPTPDYFQSLEYRALIARWRAFKFLRKYSDSTPGDFFKLLTPEQTLDRYSYNKEDICYLAGEMLEIRSSTQDTYMLLGCYINPIIDENSYSSWIALDHPYAIVYEAARSIFKQTGWDEQAAAIRQEVAEQYQILKQEVTAYGE
jgi:hypothetical protein